MRFDPREYGAKCDICPLRKQRPVPPTYSDSKTRFVIVGEAPGHQEIQKGEVFIGPSGKLLDKLLYDVDLERREAHVTNTLLCRPEHDEQFEAARACCAPRLFRELRALPPEAPIIAMGKEAAKSLLGVGGILKSRGFIWEVPRLTKKQRQATKKKAYGPVKNDKERKARRAARVKLLRQKVRGRVVLPTIHPAFVLRSQIWQAVLQVDIERIARFIHGGNRLALEDRCEFVVVSSAKRLRRLGKKLGKEISCDIETTGLHFQECEIRCVGVGDAALKIIAYPWKRRMARVLSGICRKRTTIGHNFICFDALVLRYNGVKLNPARIEDTMVATHAFASHLPKSLLHVGSVFCDLSPWKHAAKGESKGEKGAPTQIDKLSPKKLVAYNASDVEVTHLSWFRMQNDLDPERHTYEGDKKIATLCSRMTVAGFRFDRGRCRELDDELKLRAGELLREIRGLTRMSDFNPANPYDVRRALYRKFGAPLLHLTPTGLPATGKSVLEQLKADTSKIGRLSDLVLRWRAATKTRNTFLSVHVSRDGRVHAGWRVGPVTGRLACRGPNLMNIPRYTPDKDTNVVDLCDRVRECYIPRKGCVIVYFDLAQAEARFAANLSCDQAFISACAGDVHAGNAKVIFPEEAKKGWLDGKEAKSGRGKPFRDVAKNSGFAIYYLAGWETVYERLTADGFPVSPSDCRGILDAIHSTYTRYYDFVAENVDHVKATGFLRTFGAKRIRWFGPFPNPSEVANFPIQGGIADHMNDRLLQLEQRLSELPRKGATIIAQVHDAGLIETRLDLVEDVKGLVKEVYEPDVRIEGCAPFKIPIDLKESDRWSQF